MGKYENGIFYEKIYQLDVLESFWAFEFIISKLIHFC